MACKLPEVNTPSEFRLATIHAGSYLVPSSYQSHLVHMELGNGDNLRLKSQSIPSESMIKEDNDETCIVETEAADGLFSW